MGINTMVRSEMRGPDRQPGMQPGSLVGPPASSSLADPRPDPRLDATRIDLRAPALRERAYDLHLLQQGFAAAREGGGGTFVICGSAGMGKTSLVDEFLAGLDHGQEGATVFHGGCDDLIAPRSFGPFRDMARTTGLLSDEMISDPNREDLLAGLMGVLDRPTRPAVVVVEDAHWADDASIDVLRYLARRIVSMHAMLIVTLRDREVDRSHPVRNLLAGPTSTAPTRIDLRPLSLEAVTEMADQVRSGGGDREPGLDPRALYEVSGGNPFLVGQLLAADPRDTARSTRETLVARAERLSPEGRDVLQVLAVLPEGADPTVARLLFGDVPAALHEAEGSGLLTSSTDRIRFRHELGRSAIVESMSFGERMASTNQVLDALIDAGADPAVLVHLSRAAGDGRRATRFAIEVLDNGLAPTSHREAWKLNRIALECTTDLSAERVAQLHLAAARAGRVTNNHAEAVVHAERAVELLIEIDGGGVDRDTLVSAWLNLALIRVANSDHHRGAEALHRAKDLLDDGEVTEEWVRCNTLMAWSAMIAGNHDTARERATESVELAERHGWTQELVYALGVRAITVSSGSDPGSDPASGSGGGERADLDRAIRLGAAHGPADRHAANLHNRAVLFLRDAEMVGAEDAVDEAERYAREHGLDNLVFHSQVQRAHLMIYQGRTDEAEALVNEILGRTGDPGSIKASADAALARIWTRRGDPAAAQLVERAWSDAAATGEIQKIALAGITRQEHMWLDGEDEALRRFAHHLAALGERYRHHRLRAEALRMLMRLGEEVEPFEGCPQPLAAALAGDHQQSAELWDGAGQPYERALELVESTDTPVAFEGLRLLDRTGATRTADLVRQRLRVRGLQGVPRGPRKAADGVVPVLTGRQADVLRLIAEGMTNAQIADELFVARRTVDNHVSAILGRLGAESRHDAVEEARARGML